MTSLSRELRKELEKAVKAARRVAEIGARRAIEQLGVGESEAPAHLASEQRALRNQLRAHGRQLGDRRDTKSGTQATTRLVQECAYEHWHRMLFARFLAENRLLVQPESGIAVTIDEAREIGREKSVDWLELASEYAERMLPQIFRRGDPVLDVKLPPEKRVELEGLLERLPLSIFHARDSLGWVYQFWQSERKSEVNQPEIKIGPDELPAATQLFTEDYMVLFLIHNTIGAWWAGKILETDPNLALRAANEDELRLACSVGTIEWTYLRFIREADGAELRWRPAAGEFAGWPQATKDITLLDPCMGSGHFLVVALPILTELRMAEEGLSREDAILAVLRDNLFGLEIDSRCAQIAAFSLALTAWRAVGYRPLPLAQLACSGLAIGVAKAEWFKLTTKFPEREKNALERLYDLFTKAPLLGSLIEPHADNATIFASDFTEIKSVLSGMLSSATSEDAAELTIAAQGIAKAAELLTKQFTLVATNVPYLGRKRQQEALRTYCEQRYPSSKQDLATCFVERCMAFCKASGSIALVFPQNALFLKTYKAFRYKLLTEQSWQLCVKLGARAFQTSMYDFGVTLSILQRAKPRSARSFSALDTGNYLNADQKAVALIRDDFSVFDQKSQLANPDHAIVFGKQADLPLLEDYANPYQGAGLADIVVYRKLFWEVQNLGRTWALHQSSPNGKAPFTGMHFIVLWEGGKGTLVTLPEATIRGRKAWGKRGVACTVLGNLPVGFYIGTLFDNSAAAIIPKNPEHLGAIWCFMSSPEYLSEIRRINQKAHVADATLVKVPFDLPRWQKVSNDRYPDGLPEPYTDDPTQWLYSGRPKDSGDVLQVAIARLLGYRWPAQNDKLDAAVPMTFDGLERHVDEDGIACLAALQGKPPAAQRLMDLLADALDRDWSATKLAKLLAGVGFAGKTMDEWLRDGFFAQHCSLFWDRPFIWHVWDGRHDGFHAFVNYHRLASPGGDGLRTLEKLLYSYLGDWINRQRADQKAGVEGADARFVAAQHLKAQLTNIITGEPPFDIFVRWKSLPAQPLGWEPDINDGVRVNIRPFIHAQLLGARASNACILRIAPNIKYTKDRGREPMRDEAEYPWLWGWNGRTQDFLGSPTFDGCRWNDLHYSRAVKQAAREKASVRKAQVRP